MRSVGLDRGMYRRTGGGHKDDRTTFTGAAANIEVIAGDAAYEITVDRVFISAGAAAVTVTMAQGGTAVGPKINVPANTSDGVETIVAFDAGEGVDITLTGGAADVYLDYHRNAAGK